MVLSNTNSQEQSANLQAWKVAYEQATGHKVLHISVHLDEGYMGTDGKPQYNPHSHVIVSRMDSKNRVIHLGRKQLAQVQDLTAEHLKMERGSTLDERKGHRGRKHVPHREFRQQADAKRLELDGEKENTAKHLDRLLANIDQSQAKRKKVKEAHAAELEAKANQQTAEIAQLKAEYAAERATLKASGEAEQADYMALKKTHEAALADLTTAQTKAAKVPQLETEAVQAQAQIDQLTPLAALVPDLKTKLATAQLEADKVPELVATVSSQADQIAKQTEAFDKLKTEAMNIITPLRTQVKTMGKQITQLETDKAELAATADKWAAKANAYQAEKANGTPAHVIDTTGVTAAPAPLTSQSNPLTPAPVVPLGPNARAKFRASRTAQEAPKQPEAPTPSPAPVKSVVERLGESWDAMLDWIKSIGGAEHEPVTASSLHCGPVKHLDDLHCIQKSTRTGYAIHQLAHLDKVPAPNDPDMVIRYKDGKGTVEGKSGPRVQR